MGQPKRFTNQEIIDAYKQTGSIWRAAKLLGACGQSVWERLRALDYVLPAQMWSTEEDAELRLLIENGSPLGEATRRLGRTYAAVASRVHTLGLKADRRKARKLPRGAGLDKESITKHIKQIAGFKGSLKQYCRQHGLDLELLVKAIQRYDMEFWKRYSRESSSLQVSTCPQCSAEYIPMTAKQKTCSRKCSSDLRVDRDYFGGNRSNTIGLAEGICQLCEKPKPRLSSHHIFGKENDPANEFLIALCAGCHQAVTHLGGRADVTSPAFWETLINLAILRKLGPKKPMGIHTSVEIEEMTEEDVDYELDQAS